MDQTILELYHRISQNKSFRDRACLGNRGDLIEIEDNQIIKADRGKIIPLGSLKF